MASTVHPEDIKIEPQTGSETTEELDLEDILDNISDLPMDPLPGHDMLGQPHVEQDVNDNAHQPESSDDDSADWPAIRPLRIDLGVPVQLEEHRPQDRGRPRRSCRVEKNGKERGPSEYPATRSARRGQTRSRSPKHRPDAKSELPESRQRNEREEEEDQLQMEVEEYLKYAVAQAKERELNLDKVERARQRLRENKEKKKNWAAAKRQLDLNEQEDSETGQEFLMQNIGPQGSLDDPELKALTLETPQDGHTPADPRVWTLDGRAGWIGRTGRRGHTTRTGQATQTNPESPDVIPVEARRETGIVRGGETLQLAGHDPHHYTNTGKLIPTTTGPEVGILGGGLYMNASERKLVKNPQSLSPSAMKGEMTKLLDETEGGATQVNHATKCHGKIANPRLGTGGMFVEKVVDPTRLSVTTGDLQTLLTGDCSPPYTGPAGEQRTSRYWTEVGEGQINSSSSPASAGEGASVEDQTRQLSLGTAKARPARLRFRIKDGQLYHHTVGQPAPETSSAESKPSVELKAPMTQEREDSSNPGLTRSGPERSDPCNQRVQKTQDFRGRDHLRPREQRNPGKERTEAKHLH